MMPRMRKGRFLELVNKLRENCERDAAFAVLAEEAGVEWEPEPVELPERLQLGYTRTQEGIKYRCVGPNARSYWHREETALYVPERLAEAFVARWNALHALRRELRETVDVGKSNKATITYLDHLERLLDAAEGPKQ